MRSLFEHMIELAKVPGLPQTAREVAILAVGSHTQAVYEIYSHERIALSATSLTREQADLIKIGKRPTDMDESCNVAFDAALELAKVPGPLSGQTWERIKDAFGQDGAQALIHYIGFYLYMCTLLNGFDVRLPEGQHIG